ncbi:MAG: hypothetical protein ACLP0B_11575 [Steroidobacteraceae bacterium]
MTHRQAPDTLRRRSPARGMTFTLLTGKGDIKVAKIEERELEGHRNQLIADVRKLVEKYRAIFDWDVPDIDQAAADKLILTEVRRALDALEPKLLG